MWLLADLRADRPLLSAGSTFQSEMHNVPKIIFTAGAGDRRVDHDVDRRKGLMARCST